MVLHHRFSMVGSPNWCERQSPTNFSLSLSNYNLVVIVDCEEGDLVWSSKYISQNTTVIRGRQVIQYWKYIFYISPSMSASFETFIAHRIYHHPDLEKGGGVAHHHRNHPFPQGNRGGGLNFPRCVFGLKKRLVHWKETKNFLNVPRRGGVTDLGLSPKKTFFYTHPHSHRLIRYVIIVHHRERGVGGLFLLSWRSRHQSHICVRPLPVIYISTFKFNFSSWSVLHICCCQCLSKQTALLISIPTAEFKYSWNKDILSAKK